MTGDTYDTYRDKDGKAYLILDGQRVPATIANLHLLHQRNAEAGLPDDLLRALKSGVLVNQDAAVFEAIERWRNAPSNTASGFCACDSCKTREVSS